MITMTKFRFGAVAFWMMAFCGANVQAKVSDDNRLFRQVDNINAAFKACDLSNSPLSEIRSKAVATGVTSGVATVSSVVSMGASISAASKSGKQAEWDTSKEEKRAKVEGNNNELKSKRTAATVASGIATGANAASLVLSATSWSNLKKLMNDSDDCYRALENIKLVVPVRVAAEEEEN